MNKKAKNNLFPEEDGIQRYYGFELTEGWVHQDSLREIFRDSYKREEVEKFLEKVGARELASHIMNNLYAIPENLVAKVESLSILSKSYKETPIIDRLPVFQYKTGRDFQFDVDFLADFIHLQTTSHTDTKERLEEMDIRNLTVYHFSQFMVYLVEQLGIR